jgi:hypothetical protein
MSKRKLTIKNLKVNSSVVLTIILVIVSILVLFSGLTKEEKLSSSTDLMTSQLQQTEVIPSEEMMKFVECLKEVGFTIFGANWCGETKRLVNTFGGWEIVDPIYVECTKERETCEERRIRGYPTIFIGEEEYRGMRTLEEFARVTGCEISFVQKT